MFMDSHQHHYQQHEEINPSAVITSNNNSNSSKSTFALYRQSSTRWIPTCEQVRILRDLYYNRGVRSPTPEQIQKISTQLRQYGKIEGKNVFYWFQNHKARERQKKRLTVDIPNPTTTNSPTNTTNMSTTGFVLAPGAGVSGDVQMGSSCCDGSTLMGGSFSESCQSGGGGRDGWRSKSSKGWVVGMESAAVRAPWMYQCAARKQGAAAAGREIETLPLFPVHSQGQEEDQQVGWGSHLQINTGTSTSTDVFGGFGRRPRQCDGYFPGYCGGGGGGGQQEVEEDGYLSNSVATTTSLELSLSSCYYCYPGST